MPHVTFIHGMCNKPPAEDLLRIWRRALADGADPLPLGDLGVATSLVYWADLLYEKPEDDLSAHESALENSPEAIDAGGSAPPPRPRSAEEEAFLAGLRAKMTSFSDAELEGAAPKVKDAPPGALEGVPLPWFIKKAFLNAYLRDVHHYLFDVVYGPPGRPRVPIQQTIRRRFVEALGAPAVSRPHVVVSHSMGTVIAYDCLKRVADCAPVDGLITLGSPLGLDEIQDELQPGWSRADGYPERVEAGWANLFDRLDPVCGFDPVLGNDYRKHDAMAVEDLPVENDGLWRHSATKYLRQASFGRTLRRLLQARGGSP
jgi:hypothetical protein